MSTPEILLLGAIAGVTIFLGLPVGRMQGLSPNARSGLSALATGILVFLLWDVLSNAVDPIDASLHAHRWGRFAELSTLGAVGFTGGLMSLVYYDTWMKRRRRRAFLGPGAASTAEFEHDHHFTGMSPARWLAIFIATGIGLHNFSEGLAIGQSAATGAIAFVGVLVVGFALHNITEGFGIAAPMAMAPKPVSWGFLGLTGLVGGAPTFIGSLVGYLFRSDLVYVLFLALAAGALVYVLNELFNLGRKLNSPPAFAWGLLLGFLTAYATDLLLTFASGA
jgi:ZIP family zinc transporter